MNLRRFGQAGGWTAIGVVAAIAGILLTQAHYRDQDQRELMRRVGALEVSSVWVEGALHQMAEHDGISLPPRPARQLELEPIRDWTLAADTIGRRGDCR